MSTKTLTIEKIVRLESSVNGNPRYDISWKGGGDASITSSDCAFAYSIGNPGYRVGDTVEVEFTRAGRIADMTEPESPMGVMSDQEEEERETSIDEARTGEADPDDPDLIYHGNGEWRREPLPTSEPVVFIATRFTSIEDPDSGGLPFEIEDHVAGVFNNEASAWQALAEDGAMVWEETVDFDDDEERNNYMDEYRWDVIQHSVLS